MKKHASLACIMTVSFALFFLSGCIPPSHGITFSHDSKRMVYVDHQRDGIVQWNLETGKSELLYKPADKYMLFGVFWPDGKSHAYIVESNGGDCTGEGTEKKEPDILLKRFDTTTRKTELVARARPGCVTTESTSDGGNLSVKITSGFNFLSMISTEFDLKTKTVEFGGLVVRKSDKAPSPFAALPRSKKEAVLSPAVSPKGDYIAFITMANATDPGQMQKTQDADMALRLMRLSDKKVFTILKAPISPKNDKGAVKETLFAPLSSGLKWRPDGKAFYFVSLSSVEKPVLHRCDPATRKITIIFDKPVIAYDPFPKGNRLLVLHADGDRRMASIIEDDGKVESSFDALTPDSLGNSLTVSPDGRYASAYFSNGGFESFERPTGDGLDDVFLPVLFDLKTHKESMLVFHPEDNAAAGRLYFVRGRYETALTWFKKAGKTGLAGAYLSLVRLQRDNEEAPAYQAAIERFTAPEVDAHIELAKIISGYKDLDLAEMEFQKASDPFHARALYETGHMFKVNNLPSRAIPYFEKAVAAYEAKGCYEDDTSKCDDSQTADSAKSEMKDCRRDAGDL